MTSLPSQNDFLKLTQKGNLIPIYKELLGDLDTPVSAFFKVASQADYSYLLESVEGEEKVARYSFLSKDPEIVIQSKNKKLDIISLKDKESVQTFDIKNTPFDYIRKIMSQYELVDVPGLPRFCGGLVGYLGYDIVRFFERLPNKPADDLNLPDILLMLSKDIIIFDHLNHKIKVVQCVHLSEKMTDKQKIQVYQEAIKKIDVTVKQLRSPLQCQQGKSKASSESLTYRSNFTEKEFTRIVKEVKKRIKDGDIIQTVLSQRFEVDLQTDAFHIYRTLRGLNPSPYMYFLKFKKIQIVGSSPELLVRCEDGVVETRPIAGTRPRGENDKQDKMYSQDLLNDPKEIAEHIMLVDLGRNDLGRVCQQGTIYVDEFMSVEKYSHVMHIVSNVKGKLKSGNDSYDVLQAAFPAGTVSGAPKIRAMEIIDELENVSRGPYAGCIGYFSFSGNLDSCITIRTIVVVDGKAYIQAGAGIVADSQPKKEYIETTNKAKAQLLAIDMAHEHSTEMLHLEYRD